MDYQFLSSNAICAEAYVLQCIPPPPEVRMLCWLIPEFYKLRDAASLHSSSLIVPHYITFEHQDGCPSISTEGTDQRITNELCKTEWINGL